MFFKLFYPALVVPFLYSGVCFAHGAHEHGTAKIDIAIDAKIVNVRIEVPSISIYGFEHAAKTEKEISEVELGMKKLNDNIANMVVFPAALNCKMTVGKMDNFVKEEDDEPENILVGAEHGNVVASFTFGCSKTLASSLVKFSFSKVFPAIHRLKVQVLGNNVQKGATMEGPTGELQL